MRGVKATALQGRAWQRLLATTQPEYRRGFRNWVATGQEFRALQSDDDELGGYLVTPMQMVDRLIKAIDDAVFIRQWATVFAVPNAQSLGAPALDADPADADWTTELATGTEDSTMSFGQRVLTPAPLAKRIKVSRKLLRQVPNSEGLVMERLGYKFGITYEKASLTGDGNGQPLGVFTASALGISTGRDVATDNTATAVTFNGLLNAKYALKQGYWGNAKWLAHRDFFKQVSKLVDGEGRYLWRESVRVGEPDTVLNVPVFMSEYAPNTFTSGKYVAVLGDFSNYWIADSMAMDFQRLVELYAETNQVGLIGRLESDGMPVLEEAFVRVQLGS
jgi:HK97 family phage major capsid protein